uniref:Methyltransferase domain-containing protein n=1 Tax=Candidatus Kentrum sp. SD TaxID=2126332 RepID=A0A450YD86_9GAMM|nr:MAG: Methyltransferase domain-containing protein [Candidatus Kentron sp. SD]VFK44529.1 MAG: Methyltransferase domain-containing protein [Candidatus Kentron sp. SD]
MTQNKQLYNSPGIWNQDIQKGQQDLLQALIDFVPENCRNILDVGCGDGKITSRFARATGLTVIGVDASEEALSRCDFETMLGDASRLKLPDGAFDAVMSLDLLEHLPDEEEEKAWTELFRVALKAVLVAVPFREELLDGMTRCAACGQQYHVNWHMRAYDWPELIRRTPNGWKPSGIVLTGEAWSPYHPLETRIRRELLDEWSGWPEAICPHCGKSGQPANRISVLPSSLATVLGQAIYENVNTRGSSRTHSEILVLYCREEENNGMIVRTLPLASHANREASRALLDTPHLEQHLIPFPASGRTVIAADHGIVVQLPVYQNADTLHIQWRKQSEASLDVLIEDGLGMLLSAQVSSQDDNNEMVLTFPRSAISGYYGVLIRLPSPDAIVAVSLGRGPAGMDLYPIENVSAAYYPTQYANVPAFIQVTEPTWIDSRMLSEPIHASKTSDTENLFDAIKRILDSKQNVPGSELIPLDNLLQNSGSGSIPPTASEN